MTPQRIELRIDGLPNLQADKLHWRTRHTYRKRWHRRVESAVLEWVAEHHQPIRTHTAAQIVYTRHSSHHTAPDSDNLAYSFKAVQDGLVKCGVIADDSPEHIAADYLWEKCPRGQGFITIIIEAVP